MIDNTDSSKSGDRTGQQLGNYCLLRLIGEGRDAQVYLAEHVELGQHAAVKVFQVELSERDSKLFYEQVRVFAPLLHPHILRVHEAGMDGTTPFLVMDYAPNGTLRQRHPHGTVLAPDAVVAYVKDIADALQYAHDQGVSHQNLRPENILVGSREELYISDFAIPIISQNIRSTDMLDVARNMIYTGPETPLGAEGDQYALASMTYEWLSGTSTYHGTGVEVVFQRMTRPPVPLREHVPTLAPAIETVVMRGLEKRAARRFASIQAFAEAFEQACAAGITEVAVDRPAQGVEVSTPQETAEWTYSYASLKVEQLERQPFSSGFTYSTHAVKTIAFSPDGKRIAFASWDSAVNVCDIADGGNVFTYKGHSDPVHGIAWSPDTLYLATASGTETAGDVQVWKAESGELVCTYKGHVEHVQCVQWSPDGKRIASGSFDKTVHIWDALTGENVLIYGGHDMLVETLAWSPDGGRVASSAWGGPVQVWESGTGNLICTYRGHLGRARAIAWSPDGALIASGGDDKTVQIWDARTKKLRYTYRAHASNVISICWTSNGKRIRSASWDNAIREWNVEFDATPRALANRQGDMLLHYPLLEFKQRISAVAWSPDTTRLAIGIEDRRVLVYDNEAGAMYICRAPAPAVELLGETQEERAGSVEADTPAQSRKPVRGWGNARDTLVYYEHGNAVKSVAWSPDGERIVSGSYDSTARVWDVATQTTLVTYPGHNDPVERAAWSPDGQYIASASLDTTVQVWKAANGERVCIYQGHNKSVWAIAWSPDGKHIVSGSEDGTAQVWGALTGEPVLTYDKHNGPVETVAWSPDGQSIASGSDDSTVRIWEAQSGEDILTYAGPGSMLSLAWSPDGKRIASGGDISPVMQEDGTISRTDEQALHVWDAATGKDVLAFGQHFHRIYSLCWSPDGKYLAFSSIHHKVDVHDAATGEYVAFHYGHNDFVFAIAWSPDGKRVASASQDGTVRVWRVEESPWDNRMILWDIPG